MMKLLYKGAFRNHGLHTIHDSQEMRRPQKGEWLATNKKSVLVNVVSGGVNLRFDGTANLNKNADYEFTVSLSDNEILELFEARFGLQTTPLHVKKELFGELLKRQEAAGLPSPHIPLLSAPIT